MEYRVLGKLEVVRDGTPLDIGAFKQRSLLALLLMNANNVVSTDRILEELWGEDEASDRQNTLWVYVSNLRKVLDPDREKRTDGTVLLTRSPGYVLQVDPQKIDSLRFEAMVEEGRSLADTDAAAGSLLLTEALGLWSGRAFEDFTYEPFARDEIDRLEERRLEAVSVRIDADLQRGLSRELVSELESLVRQHPLREELTGQLMLALYRSGRQAEALRAYQVLASRLGEELGIEPSAQVRKLEERIVTSDAAVDAPVADTAGARAGLTIRGYELREQIGEGAYGVAYRAYQPGVGREVAIKAIRPELANSPAFIRRFEAEAQLVARLEHPHIVPLYDYWREPNAAYLVMRLMRGGSLQDAIAAGPLTNEQAARVAEQIGSALELSHSRGVIHRDIKPANILIDDDGNAYLADFGIARVGDDEGVDHYMKAATLAPPFASPEQAARNPISESSDIYSLGVVLAQAITGLSGDVHQIRGALGDPVARIIDRATHPEREERYGEVGRFVADFVGAMSAERVPRPEPTTPSAAENPYKGLRAFQQADANDFFGRDELVQRLLDRLGESGPRSRFVALVGPSGSGKSSVVKAGLLPALARGALPLAAQWFRIELTPAPHPFEELEAALLNVAVDPPASLLEQLAAGESGLRRAARRVLPDEDSQLLIVIDQLEELFTQVDPETADRFLDAVVGAVNDERSRVRVVATLRADFYDRPLRHRAFGELLREGTEVITPMSPEDLERAICGPAQAAGVGCAPTLVATLIGDVADRPGALPLLQYTMTELYDGRDSDELSVAAYQQVGGVSGALAKRAERLLADLSDSGRRCARLVLLSLVTLGEGAEDTRRRVLQSELDQLPVSPADLRAVLDSFGRHRLFSFDRDPVTRGPTIEISHEALLSQWDRLAGWIDDARVDLRNQRALRDSAQEWLASGRDASFLLNEGRHARYEDWARTSVLELGAIETEYVEASKALLLAKRAEAEQQARRELELEKKAKRRLAGVAFVLALGVVIAGLLSVVAFQQRREANQQRDEAAVQRELAVEQGKVAEAQRDEADRQRAAVAEALTFRIAEQLPDRIMALRRGGETQLALALAGEALVLAHESGVPLADAVAALHLALQDVGVRFPSELRDVALVSAPEGVRAVFVLDLGGLLDLREAHLTRPLSQDECIEYLAGECVDAEVRDRLPNETLRNAVLETRIELPVLEGTALEVSVDSRGLAADLGFITWTLAFLPYERAFGASVEVDVWSEDSIAGVPQSDVITSRRSSLPSAPVSLTEIVDLDAAAANVPKALNDLLDIDGERIGLWAWYDVGSSVWFRPDIFEELGVAVPTTWDELVEITDLIAAAGQVPWCVGLVGTEAAIPIMTMVQSQILDEGGTELFDAWASHTIPANDPRIVRAHRKVADLIFDERYNGGIQRVKGAPGNLPALLSPDNECAMWVAPASWAQGANRNLLAPAELGVFPIPTASPTALVAGEHVSLHKDRPESRLFMRFMTSIDFGLDPAAKASTTAIAANMRLPVARYSDPLSRTLASAARSAAQNDALRLDIFELRPELREPYHEAIQLWFDGGAESLEGILADLEAQWQQLEAGG